MAQRISVPGNGLLTVVAGGPSAGAGAAAVTRVAGGPALGPPGGGAGRLTVEGSGGGDPVDALPGKEPLAEGAGEASPALAGSPAERGDWTNQTRPAATTTARVAARATTRQRRRAGSGSAGTISL